jgi:hypothetical protein
MSEVVGISVTTRSDTTSPDGMAGEFKACGHVEER